MPPTDSSGPAGPGPGSDTGSARGPDADSDAGPGPDAEDTLDLDLDLLADLPELIGLPACVPAGSGAAQEANGVPGTGGIFTRTYSRPVGSSGDLLDALPGWGSVSTDRGAFQLVPVVPARDLPVVARWMNDPAVAAFWDLAGPEETTDRHLRAQLQGDGRSTPCLGVLDGRPMSYWEIYRADLDALARYYPARPHDTGIHLLIGRITDRGHGLGGALLRAVADHILDHRPACARVVAEPDLRNTASVAAFLAAGFRFSAELELPGKRAALMIRERRLRRVL